MNAAAGDRRRALALIALCCFVSLSVFPHRRAEGAGSDGAIVEIRVEIRTRSALPSGMGSFEMASCTVRVRGNAEVSEFDVYAAVLEAGAYRGAVVDQPIRDATSGNSIRAMAARRHAVIATNGSYFDRHFAPVGLCRIEAAALGERSAQRSLSGALALDASHRVRILPIGEVPADCATALQAGPFLIDPRGRAGIASDNGQQARRTAIGSDGHGRIVVMTTSPVTLLMLSQVLARSCRDLGWEPFDRVLNLDGGPSTAMEVDGETIYEEDAPVRNAILFLPVDR